MRPRETDPLDRLLGPALRQALDDSGDGCPDAGLLAAYQTGAVKGTERTGLDAHVAGCGRCQAQVALLARLEPEPERTGLSLGWWSWRWVVPVAAGVVGLVTAWSLVPAPRDRAPQPVDQVASDLPSRPFPSVQPVSPLPRAANEPEARPPGDERFSSPAKVGDEANRRADAELQRRERLADDAQGRAIAEIAASPPIGQTPPTAPAAARPAEETVAEKRAESDRADQAKPQVTTERVGVAAAAPPALPAADARAMLSSVSPSPIMIVSVPDSEVRWRVRRDGSLDRSGDGGQTWEPRYRALRSIRAGSAPSRDIVWFAGEAGFVVRTSDGGATWLPAALPTSGTLVRIFAADALQATVTSDDGTNYATTDGGTTWTVK